MSLLLHPSDKRCSSTWRLVSVSSACLFSSCSTSSGVQPLLTRKASAAWASGAFKSMAVGLSAAEQEALLKALAKAGAQDIKPDPSLLSGLNPAHLRPESPADLEQLIVQFAELPDVQKKRFLLLLDSQKPTKRSSAPSPKVDATSRKKTGGNPKPSEPPSDVLPVVKSSLDLLSTALKGLLGTTKDAPKKGMSGVPKIGPEQDSSTDEADQDDAPSPIDEDVVDEVDEPETTDDETTSPSEAEDQMSSGSESEPD